MSHTSPDTHSCRLHQEPLDLLPGVFHVQTLRTNSSDLSVWSSFAPFCMCTTVPNELPVLAFADSKRSHCKWIPNDSKPLLKLIRRDAFSANITIVHRIGCSLNLNISYYCSFVSWEYGCGLLSMGKQSIGKLSRMSGHLLLQKARTFGSIADFNIRCHLT